MSWSGIEVAVVGAGVIGLTTAVALAERGAKVRVITQEPPEYTLSVRAGAIWGPYMADHDFSLDWSLHTLTRLQHYSIDPGSGIEMVPGIEGARSSVEPPNWAEKLPGFRICDRAELPDMCVSGWAYSAPVVDMPRYLSFLKGELIRLGGSLSIARVDTLAIDGALVVNCSGLGARTLVPDPTVQPIRGQLVVVDNPGIETFFLEHEEEPPHLTYYMPQGNRVILGGTAEEGREDLEPDEKAAYAIVQRCAAIEPRLARAEVKDIRVGVRPHRPVVRVERDENGVIHNYGHGGSGLTLSWGCAAYVCGLVEEMGPAFSRR